ncbi:unnamed protein product, partial [Ectocarpus sp. 6 AP-2014]
SIVVDRLLFAGRRRTPCLPGSPVSVFSRTCYRRFCQGTAHPRATTPSLGNTKTKESRISIPRPFFPSSRCPPSPWPPFFCAGPRAAEIFDGDAGPPRPHARGAVDL